MARSPSRVGGRRTRLQLTGKGRNIPPRPGSFFLWGGDSARAPDRAAGGVVAKSRPGTPEGPKRSVLGMSGLTRGPSDRNRLLLWRRHAKKGSSRRGGAFREQMSLPKSPSSLCLTPKFYPSLIMVRDQER